MHTHMINGIVAVDRKWCIGKNNDLPWELKDDLKHFADTTRNKIVVVGRITQESIVRKIGHPLKNRTTVVLSRNKQLKMEGCEVRHSTDDILKIYKNREMYICGGNKVYNNFLDHISRLLITHVETEVSGDIWFPTMKTGDWRQKEIARFEQNDRNEFPFRIVEYTRRPRT